MNIPARLQVRIEIFHKIAASQSSKCRKCHIISVVTEKQAVPLFLGARKTILALVFQIYRFQFKMVTEREKRALRCSPMEFAFSSVLWGFFARGKRLFRWIFVMPNPLKIKAEIWQKIGKMAVYQWMCMRRKRIKNIKSRICIYY